MKSRVKGLQLGKFARRMILLPITNDMYLDVYFLVFSEKPLIGPESLKLISNPRTPSQD